MHTMKHKKEAFKTHIYISNPFLQKFPLHFLIYFFFLDWTDYNIISNFISQANEMLADILKP